MKIRLQKWLSQAGVASRRKAEEMILAGRVSLNGEVITILGQQADTTTDKVTVDGKPCVLIQQKVYIALHKPVGVVTTVRDQFNRPTVMDFVPDGIGLFPVGRLDYDTSGLLLITNDGMLAQHITHPKHEVIKVYIAMVKGVPTKEMLIRFAGGVIIDGKPSAPCKIELLDTINPNAKLQITLHEGRNRQVRRMCEAIGCPVVSLKRIAVGAIDLGQLAKGEWRHLTREEVRMLQN